MTALVLLGGGGHASDVLAVVEAMSQHGAHIDLVYVADDHWSRPDRFEGRAIEVKMVESIEAGANMAPFVVAVGYPGARRHLHDLALAVGATPADAIIHPHASLGTTTALAVGAVVMGSTWLSPGVSVGAHCHVGYGVTVGHDTVVGQFASLMPGASIGGDTVIGEGALIGANATILQGTVIGTGAVVGAGAVVTRNVQSHSKVAGVPARQID